MLTNLHAFAVIVPNHTGSDVQRFADRPGSKGAYYLRQISGSVDHRSNDMLCGWLNYQIEHHLWPDLPLRQQALARPLVREICKKHGIPYREEPLLRRLRSAIDVMVGRTSMEPA